MGLRFYLASCAITGSLPRLPLGWANSMTTYSMSASTSPMLRTLLDTGVTGTAVPQLLQAVREAPGWWQAQIAKAAKLQHAELQVCAQLLRERREGACNARTDALETSVCPEDPSAAEEKPYVCDLCAARFRLRKHLCLHAAKTHRLLSPARHFAITEWCTACHRFYASVGQVQQHLKHSSACLRRCVDLHPPLSAEQIQRLETACQAGGQASTRWSVAVLQRHSPGQSSPRLWPIPPHSSRASRAYGAPRRGGASVFSPSAFCSPRANRQMD